MTKQETSTFMRNSVIFRTIRDMKISVNENESLKDFTVRVYPLLSEWLQSNKDEPAVSELLSDMSNSNKGENDKYSTGELYTAIVNHAWRYAIAMLHSPFVSGDQPEKSDSDLLSENGISVDMQKNLPSDALAILLKKFRTPTDKKPATEIRAEQEKHFKNLEPVIPSAKKFVLKYQTNSETKEQEPVNVITRDYHWKKEIQDSYVKDHEKFSKFIGS